MPILNCSKKVASPFTEIIKIHSPYYALAPTGLSSYPAAFTLERSTAELLEVIFDGLLPHIRRHFPKYLLLPQAISYHLQP